MIPLFGQEGTPTPAGADHPPVRWLQHYGAASAAPTAASSGHITKASGSAGGYLLSRILRPAHIVRELFHGLGLESRHLGRRRGRPVGAMTATWRPSWSRSREVSCRHRSRRNSINNQWSARPIEMVCGHIEDPRPRAGHRQPIRRVWHAPQFSADYPYLSDFKDTERVRPAQSLCSLDVGVRAAATRPLLEAQLFNPIAPAQIIEKVSRFVFSRRV